LRPSFAYLQADDPARHTKKVSLGWLGPASRRLLASQQRLVAMLPLILLGLTWWSRRVTSRDVIRLAPFMAVAVALAGVNVWFQTLDGNDDSTGKLG